MTDTASMRILSMEDDPALALLMRKRLERRGFSVDIAPNGEVGLSMAGANRYDLLIVDYHMPLLGGVDVIRALAASGLKAPVIMVTGEGNESVAVEALKLGVSDYLVKDAEMNYLELLPSVIDQVLSKQQFIKERIQMQEAVRESEERYRRLVELSPDGIAVHVEGTLTFLNLAGARLLGASYPSDCVGVSLYDFLHEESREAVRVRFRQLGDTANAATWVEAKFVRRDGTVIDVEVAGIRFAQKGQQAVQIIFRDITDRKQMAQRLEKLALYDTLTGLPNRTLFYDRMNQLLALAKRNQYILALLYVDLDQFKDVNDRLGHEAGDALLQEASQRMTACTRKADTVARMGGDEFVGICGRIASPQDAGVVANKIINALSRPFHLKGQECSIGASVGISLYPLDGDDVETLVHKADQAMYRVKAGGKSGFLYFSPL